MMCADVGSSTLDRERGVFVADVAERCVVVTGGASGIGLAVTEMLLERWPGVVVGAIDLEGGPLTELGSHSGVAAVPCDVLDRAQVRSPVALFAETVPVVGLVNGAGNHHAGSQCRSGRGRLAFGPRGASRRFLFRGSGSGHRDDLCQNRRFHRQHQFCCQGFRVAGAPPVCGCEGGYRVVDEDAGR